MEIISLDKYKNETYEIYARDIFKASYNPSIWLLIKTYINMSAALV
jgi:hypothetical protein